MESPYRTTFGVSAMKRMRGIAFALLFGGSSLAAAQQAAPPLFSNQSLYLPVYSHVMHGDVDRQGSPQRTLLSAQVSIRNTDPARPIRLVSAKYFDTAGKLVKEHVPAPKTLAPLATFELYIARSDDTGGSGASFVIQWRSDEPVNAPVVEAVHVLMTASRTLAFVTTARPIQQPIQPR